MSEMCLLAQFPGSFVVSFPFSSLNLLYSRLLTQHNTLITLKIFLSFYKSKKLSVWSCSVTPKIWSSTTHINQYLRKKIFRTRSIFTHTHTHTIIMSVNMDQSNLNYRLIKKNKIGLFTTEQQQMTDFWLPLIIKCTSKFTNKYEHINTHHTQNSPPTVQSSGNEAVISIKFDLCGILIGRTFDQTVLSSPCLFWEYNQQADISAGRHTGQVVLKCFAVLKALAVKRVEL